MAELDRQAWLDQVVEDVIDPDRPIVDPHHHLWPPGGALPYGLDDLHADTGDGHRIVHTVFVLPVTAGDSGPTLLAGLSVAALRGRPTG